MRTLISGLCVVIAICSAATAFAQEATIRIDAAQPGRPVSRYLTGACIEDVNHEIYGGIYSQMIFGESFQEPPRAVPITGFVATDGEWRAQDGQLYGEAGAGPKLVSSVAAFTTGEAGVDVYLPGNAGGNAGLIVRVGKAGAGADNFDGYEVAIDVARKLLVIGRHQHDFRLLKEVPCDVAADRWISLAVKVTDRVVDVLIDGKSVVQVEDNRPLPAGTVGLRQWQRPAKYRNFWVKTTDRRVNLPFEAAGAAAAISAMWGPIAAGDAVLETAIEKSRPFAGTQSQRITFARGSGEIGIENQGLNRWGMAFTAGKPYEGYVWLRSEKATDVFACLESRDGSRTYAQTRLAVSGDEWRRYDFTLTPDRVDSAGRFSFRLKSPGSVVVGHAFLQPGEWGRFKGLPVRRDVVQGLINQGLTVLRYGGSMVNAPEYRWKKMIGPRDRRPPYKGTWYPYSTNGWGILDFLNVCEAAGFLAIPDFNIDETPQDMADFIEYVNGPADSEWGRRRVADGHPAPYNLRHIELGNEERVDEVYYQKFERLAKAIWAKDPRIILVVGDFQYERPIADPMHIEGAASRITT
ncbi:MAG: family 16 glycoside hydrolase, partial [Bacillota bacterium]